MAGPPVGPDGKVATSTEHRLLQDIIYTSAYDREVRPVVTYEDQLKILFQLKLVQIVDVVRGRLHHRQPNHCFFVCMRASFLMGFLCFYSILHLCGRVVRDAHRKPNIIRVARALYHKKPIKKDARLQISFFY